MTVNTGRRRQQIPGPTTVPDRPLRAIFIPDTDHGGPELVAMVTDLLPRRYIGQLNDLSVIGDLDGVQVDLEGSMVLTGPGDLEPVVECLVDCG